MQLAQHPINPPIHHASYDNRPSYPSQSFIDPRFTSSQGYPSYPNAPHHAHTVYPDAVYPSQYLPTNDPHSLGHQSIPYPSQPNQYNTQYNQAHYMNNLPFAHQPHYNQGSYISQTHPAPRNPKTQIKQVKQVIYEQEPLNIPDPVRNIQYIPQLNRYMDYVEERIKIPVEKYYTDYYEVEHVTDFVPREYEESVIEMVPEEIIRYRLEYVPVERKIVHMPKSQLYDENGLFKGVGNLADRVHTEDITRPGLGTTAEINKALYENLSNSQKRGLDESLVNKIVKDIEGDARGDSQINRMQYQGLKGQSGLNRLNDSPYNTMEQQVIRNIYSQVNDSRNVNSYSNLPQNEMLAQGIYKVGKKAPSQKSRESRRRSNFVTSDGYFPNYEEELRNMESSLSASRERYM